MRHCARFKKDADGTILCEVYRLDANGFAGEPAVSAGHGRTRGFALNAAYEAVADIQVRAQVRAGLLDEEVGRR